MSVARLPGSADVLDVPPFVSVVMPVRNEADFIAKSLGAVLDQDYPHHRLEVIVADGMSADQTRTIVHMASSDIDVPVTVVDNPGRIAPTGLNAALKLARGDIVVRVDGHCRIAPDYVSRCVAHLLSTGVDGVGGPIRTISDTTTGQAIAAAMSSKFGVGGSAFRTGVRENRLVDTIAFPAYTRSALAMAGPFNEELVRNQDDEYNSRLRKLGGRLLLATDVRSDYYSRATLRSLWRQYFQYGFYKVRILQTYPRQMQPRQFVPLALVLALIATPFAFYSGGAMRVSASAIVITYAGAIMVMSIAISRVRGWQLWPSLAAAFPILHLSYGFGFLVGLPYWTIVSRRRRHRAAATRAAPAGRELGT